MNAIPEMTESNFPEEGLRFFHGLANWVEDTKGLKLHLIGWKEGQKKLTILNCVKAKQKEPLNVPENMPDNSLYVSNSCYGRYAISQLRHAFCHGNLTYDFDSKQYGIKLTDKVHIAGKFSLEAIREFVNIYLELKEQQTNK